MKKAVIFAPFWGQAGHVGNNRVERFVRWLAEDGFEVMMIRAGSKDARQAQDWGTTFTVRDPLGLYRDASPTNDSPPARKPNKLRRALSYWMFNPDPSVVWARRAARHPEVRAAATNAALILSSSPPESAHVGAWQLAQSLRLPHIVDMRDGWLDEPLKPILQNFAWRRWLEGRLESKILCAASAILVTSDGWQALLNQRLPILADKVFVLTNGYPQHWPPPLQRQYSQADKGLTLVHAGRFSGSDTRRTPDLILQPLLDGLKQATHQGFIHLIGQLGADELALIERFRAPFAELGWTLDCPGSLTRNELLRLLPQADGLLLLSASHAAIPSKLFEYIPTGRPILVVTEPESAVWRIAENLPQTYPVTPHDKTCAFLAVEGFLAAAAQASPPHLCPDSYSEAALGKIFGQIVQQHLKQIVIDR